MIYKSDIDVELIQIMGNDLTIARAAWVSTTTEQDKSAEDVEKLIPYLMKHKHGTPFEHSGMTFRVNAPIFVWREWHRHRIGFSYNEESARYKTLEPVFYIPPIERPMFKVDNWKPGRPKFLTTEETEHEVASVINYGELCENLKESYRLAYANYQMNLDLGIDPGLARDCLSVGIYSSCWVTCNPRSLMAFLSLRTHDPDAKAVSYPLYEIEVAARKLENIFAGFFPITYKAFIDNGRVAP